MSYMLVLCWLALEEIVSVPATANKQTPIMHTDSRKLLYYTLLNKWLFATTPWPVFVDHSISLPLCFTCPPAQFVVTQKTKKNYAKTQYRTSLIWLIKSLKKHLGNWLQTYTIKVTIKNCEEGHI